MILLVNDLVDPLVECIKSVTLENINRALSDVNLKCAKFQRLQSEGIINPLYSLTTQSLNGDEAPELILKLGNPHPWWKDKRTVNEATVIEFVRKSCPKIPVPKIIKWRESGQSEFGYPYILMHKVPGVTLSSIILKLTTEQKRTLGRKIVSYFNDLSQFKFDKIGSFTHDMQVSSITDDMPPLGPFSNRLEMCKGLLESTLSQINNHPYFADYRVKLEQPLQTLLRKIDSMYKKREEDSEIVLCHLDLHPGNVLVDPNTLDITSIIDWEKAGACEWSSHWTHVRLFWEDESSPEEKLPEFMDNELKLQSGKIYVPPIEDDELSSIDALFALDIANCCGMLQFWCPNWYLGDIDVTKEPIDEIRKTAMEGINFNIKEWSGQLHRTLRMPDF